MLMNEAQIQSTLEQQVIFLKKINFYECFACVYLCSTCMPAPTGDRRGVGPPGAGAMDVCEGPCGCWGSSLDPLEEQLLFLAEPSLHPLPGVMFEASAC